MKLYYHPVSGSPSVTVHNLAAADNVVARGDTVSALGEGFANSLDVTGF